MWLTAWLYEFNASKRKVKQKCSYGKTSSVFMHVPPEETQPNKSPISICLAAVELLGVEGCSEVKEGSWRRALNAVLGALGLLPLRTLLALRSWRCWRTPVHELGMRQWLQPWHQCSMSLVLLPQPVQGWGTRLEGQPQNQVHRFGLDLFFKLFFGVLEAILIFVW